MVMLSTFYSNFYADCKFFCGNLKKFENFRVNSILSLNNI